MQRVNNKLFVDIRFLVVEDFFFNEKSSYSRIKSFAENEPNFKDEIYSDLFIDDFEYYKLLWEVKKSELMESSKFIDNFYLYFSTFSPVKDVFLTQTGFYLSEENYKFICKNIPNILDFYKLNDLSIVKKNLGFYNSYQTYLLKEEFVDKLRLLCKDMIIGDKNLENFYNYINRSINVIIQKNN